MNLLGFNSDDILLVIVSFFLPPLSVLMRTGCRKDLLINILLTLLFGVPGFFHSCYIIYMTSRERDTSLDGLPLLPDDLEPGRSSTFYLPPSYNDVFKHSDIQSSTDHKIQR